MHDFSVSITFDSTEYDDWQLTEIDWSERIGGNFGGRISMRIPSSYIPFDAGFMGKRLIVVITDDDENDAAFSGIVRSYDLNYDKDFLDSVIINFDLNTRFDAMAAQFQSCSYQSQTPMEIITSVLERNDYVEDTDFEFRFTEASSYPTLDCVAQYDESDLSFLRRFCENWGVLIVYEQTDSYEETMVFVDNPQALKAGATSLATNVTGYRADLVSLQRKIIQTPTQVVLHNYNHENPMQTLTVTQSITGGSSGRYIDYDTNFRATDDDGAFLAGVRADEIAAEQVKYFGEYVGLGVRAGTLAKVTDHPQWSDLNLCFTHCKTYWDASKKEVVFDPVQKFIAVPLSNDSNVVSYRPPRVTPKPVIKGVLHGIIDEYSSDTDRYDRQLGADGSYVVRLLVHSDAADDLTMQFPSVRMAQPVGGSGAAMHFPLHPGTEVLVSFANGDPDRPYICGALPNSTDTSPVTSEDPTSNIIETAAGMKFEMYNGELTADDSGTVTGDDIRTKLYIPYDTTDGIAYLRTGRADSDETVEADNDAAAWTDDGIHEHTDGKRVTVTGGDSILFQTGMSLVQQHGHVVRLTYGTNSSGTDDSLVRAEIDYDIESSSSGRLVATCVPDTLYSTSDFHRLADTHLETSTTSHGVQTGGIYALYAAGGVSVLSQGNIVQYASGSMLVAADTVDEKVTSRTVAASSYIELSVRDTSAPSDDISSHSTLAGDAATNYGDLTGSLPVSEDAISAIASDINTDGSLDSYSTGWSVYGGWSSTYAEALNNVATTHLNLVDTQAAKGLDSSGSGPALRIDSDRAAIYAGSDDTTYLAVEDDGVQLQYGSTDIRIQVDSSGVTLVNGSNFITIGSSGISMSGGGSALTVDSSGLSASSALAISSSLSAGSASSELTSSVVASADSADDSTDVDDVDAEEVPDAADEDEEETTEEEEATSDDDTEDDEEVEDYTDLTDLDDESEDDEESATEEDDEDSEEPDEDASSSDDEDESDTDSDSEAKGDSVTDEDSEDEPAEEDEEAADDADADSDDDVDEASDADDAAEDDEESSDEEDEEDSDEPGEGDSDKDKDK